MTRGFLRPDDLHDLVAGELGADRRLVALERLAGGSKKGVYRLGLDDRSTAILYVWAPGENYWPPSPVVVDDPFTDASGADLFAVNQAALTAAGVRTPRLLMLDRDGRYFEADIALVEDAGTRTLEALLEDDPAAAAEPLSVPGDMLRRMHTTFGPRYGRLGEHAFVGMRFGEAYPALRPVDLDPARLDLYRYAQVLSLIEGPLRIADSDFPDREWMIDLAEWNIAKALGALPGNGPR